LTDEAYLTAKGGVEWQLIEKESESVFVCVCVCERERERERDRFVLRIDVIEWLETNEADVSGRTTDGG